MSASPQDTVRAAGPSAAPAIAITGLRKHYGPVRAVDGIDITVPEGQIVALLGPNGAGKTTTLDVLVGLTEPDAGEVRVFGRGRRDALDAGLVGVVLQDGDLVRGARVGELLTAVAALYQRPLDLDSVVERAGLDGLLRSLTTKLSGGQRQRVKFALALVGGPRLLVLDEPTAGLDVSAREEFWRCVRAFARAGSTVLFSTHYLEEADTNADRVIMLQEGRIVADGAPAEIKIATANRVIRATVPGAGRDELLALPGVASVELAGADATIRSHDTDATMHALLPRFPATRNIEVASLSLTATFLALTAPGAATEPEGRDA